MGVWADTKSQAGVKAATSSCCAEHLTTPTRVLETVCIYSGGSVGPNFVGKSGSVSREHEIRAEAGEA